ncbi:MAG: hypothetical protein ABSB11_10400 [Sedimentisphaerales bacterium]|jgi:hypothetical protein
MKKLLYYPSFEVQSDDWLKFALLYIDKLKPIIPWSAQKELSDKHVKVFNETDLLEPLYPTPEDAWLASLDAIRVIEEVVKKPKVYSGIIKEPDFINHWRAPSNQKCTIYSEKYSYDFERYCIENSFGRNVSEGIAIPNTLGFLYMSLLAQIMGDDKSLPPITDYKEYYELECIARRPNKKLAEKIDIAKGLLKLKIPKNLHQISLDRIIQFRNCKGFKERLHAFHDELDKYFDDLEQGKADRGFLDRRDSIFQQYSDEIVQLGGEGIQFGLGLSLFIQDPSSLLACAVEAAAGATLTINSIIGIRKTWEHTKTKRYTRKYLADLSNIV